MLRRAVEPDVEREQVRAGRRRASRPRRAPCVGSPAVLHAVARDVGADDERRLPAGRARGDPLDRGHQPGGAAVAGVLRVETRMARQLEQALHERGDRLAVIDAGLGADDEHADATRGRLRRRSSSRRAAVAASATVSSPGSATAISRAPRPAVYFAGSTPRARARSSRCSVGEAPPRQGLRFPRASSCVRFSPQAEARARAGHPERVNGHGPLRSHPGGTGTGP